MFKNKNKKKITIGSGIGSFILVLAALIFFVLMERENPFFLHLNATGEKDGHIKPDEDIVIVFNQPVKKKSVEENIQVTPEVRGEVEWSHLNQILTFRPLSPLEPSTEYQIEIKDAESILGISSSVKASFFTIPAPKIVYVTPKSNSQDISTDTKEITVRLDKSAKDFNYKFSVAPALKFEARENNDKTLYTLILKESFKKDTLYTLSVRVSYKGGKKESPSKIVYQGSFTTASPVKITKTRPENNSEVSEFQNIAITFNKDVEQDEAEKRFVITPAAGGDFRWEGTIMNFYPYKLDYNTEYKVVLQKGVSSLDGSYTTEDASFKFKVGQKPAVSNPRAVPTLPTEAIIKEGKYIDINTATQTLAIFQDGKILGAYPVSTGKASMPTPTGTFKVRGKTLRAYSRKYGLYMPFWMAFTGAGHGIHELPEWPGGYKEGQNHLGIPVSHGCVRLGIGPAETVYNFADIGTSVVVHR